MGLRESINENPKKSMMIIGPLVIVGLAIAVYSMLPERQPAPDLAFYSDDDGKTWFSDSNKLIPPFDHGGKQAVRAQVFICSDRKTPFVGYIERYEPDAKRRLEAAAAGKVPSGGMTAAGASNGLEFKRPGEAKWTPASDFAAMQKLYKSLCPSGSTIDSVVP